MAIRDMFPSKPAAGGGTYTPAADPTYNSSSIGSQYTQGQTPSSTTNSGPNVLGNIFNAYSAYKDRDVQSDVANNLGKGYTSGEGALVDWLGPYADRGNAASNTYGGLADQYQPGGPGLEGMNMEGFDPRQLRSPAYLQSTPGYNFRLEQGRKERENAAAGRGMNLSTNILRDLEGYGQDMASQEYEKEYDRLRDMYGINRDTDVANYESGEKAKMGNYEAGERSKIQQMQNYLPLMGQGAPAASQIGGGIAQMEVARGGANANREQNQGTISNQFLGSVTPGAPGKGSFTEQLGIDNFSFDDVGNAFGNMRDWFTGADGASFSGDMDGFWTGLRDFELGDLEGIFSDFF